jgi:hypothetical protein
VNALGIPVEGTTSCGARLFEVSELKRGVLTYDDR